MAERDQKEPKEPKRTKTDQKKHKGTKRDQNEYNGSKWSKNDLTYHTFYSENRIPVDCFTGYPTFPLNSCVYKRVEQVKI